MNHMFYGYDMDRTMLRIGAMNMMTHGIDNPCIEYRDSLSDQNTDKNKYSLILIELFAERGYYLTFEYATFVR